MAFERRQPSVDLRSFLDPLKPGEYFDCGGARLYGIDEALEAEALRRGRAVGDDQFQLVATDGGLIFCRASIMFAIAARWKDLTIGRPEDGTRSGEVMLPISWPTHGDLQFTVSRRLGSNVFRRWLQLQAQATRRSQVEQDVRFERTTSPATTPTDGHSHPAANGQTAMESTDIRHPERNGFSTPAEAEAAEHVEPVDLREANGSGGDSPHRQGVPADVESEPAEDSHRNGNGNGSKSADSVLQLDDSDREAIAYATQQQQRRRGHRGQADVDPIAHRGQGKLTVDPLATLDAAVVDEWVDDRVPHASSSSPSTGRATVRRTDPPRHGPIKKSLFEGDTTADPFNGHELDVDDRDAVRFEIRQAPRDSEPWAGVGFDVDADEQDATATQFMRRTVDGTDIFPAGTSGRDADAFGRPVDPAGRGDRGGRSPETVGARRSRHAKVPVPEISGARLHVADSSESSVGSSLDFRSTLLSGRRESDWVDILRRRQVLILGLVTIVALGLIALIGFLSGDGDSSGTSAGVPAAADSGAVAGPAAVGADSSTIDQGAVGSSTTVAAPALDRRRHHRLDGTDVAGQQHVGSDLSLELRRLRAGRRRRRL